MNATHICLFCKNEMSVILKKGKTSQLAACPKCGRLQRAGSK